MRKTVFSFALILFISAPLFASDIWVTGPSHKVLRNEQARKSPCFIPSKKLIKLYAARNEFVSFQIVFPGPRKNVDVSKFVLTGPKNTKLDHIELFHEHYITHKSISQLSAKRVVIDCVEQDEYRKKMKAPWEYPVQMIPFSAKKYGAPFDVADNTNEVVWVDIFVPENTPTGTYKGTVKAADTTFSVDLTVWDFTLPSVSHFPQWAYTGPEQIAWANGKKVREIGEMMPVFDSYFQMAHNHRLSLMEVMMYQKKVMKYMKAKDRNFYGYYTGENFKGPFAAGFGFELLPLKKSVPYLDVLKKEGWLNRTFNYLMDEPGSKKAYEEVIKAGMKVKKETGGQLRTFVTEQFVPSKPDWPKLDKAVDIFCSGGTHPETVAEVEKNGNIVWTYNGGWVGSILTDAPGTASRTQAWAGFVTGSRAWFFWDATYTTDIHNRWKNVRGKVDKDPKKYITDIWDVALNFDETTKPMPNGKTYPAAWSIRLNGDGLLFYPGTQIGYDGAVGCFRLKGLRQGSQDFEYLYLLEKMGKKNEAMAEAKKLIQGTRAGEDSKDGQAGRVRLNYERDPNAWDEARIRLGKMLDKIGEKAIRAKIKPYNQYPNPVGHPEWYKGKRY